ncbi:hypothetical protein [Chamaesiphon sp. VAR_48_metabat_135_sub]|uniref:hypothetical protein n=1 Tax=Chamaesiphon sp. VAR_48_metabat_135_sub TaxID=2964699 RepID=UPI00286C1DB7|nr:hypothetical protein [Chamaesiphon sp. VAR_48_metabat_135_sub]
MQKIIIKSLAVILVGTIGGLYYVWQEAIKVPDEYIKAGADNKTDSQSLPLPPSQIAEQAAVSKQKITTPIDRAKVGQKVTVKLSDRDLNNLVVAKVATSQPNKQLPVGIKGIKTNIKDGKIHTGALVNLGELAHNGKPGSQTAALTKLTDKLTFLKNRDVYIGIIGTPVVEGSKIKFGEDTEIKVGNMNFTIAQLAENLGVDAAKIQQTIDLQLQQDNFKVNRVNLENDGLSIEGAKK